MKDETGSRRRRRPTTDTSSGRGQVLGRRALWGLLLLAAVIVASVDRDPLTWVAAIIAFAIGCGVGPRISRRHAEVAGPAGQVPDEAARRHG